MQKSRPRSQGLTLQHLLHQSESLQKSRSDPGTPGSPLAPREPAANARPSPLTQIVLADLDMPEDLVDSNPKITRWHSRADPSREYVTKKVIFSSRKYRAEFLREVAILQRLGADTTRANSAGIIGWHGILREVEVQIESGTLFLEAAESDLWTHLREDTSGVLLATEEVQQRWRWFMQMAEALHYCHTHGVVHRDVKTENILLLRDGTARLADFGLSNRCETLAHLTRYRREGAPQPTGWLAVDWHYVIGTPVLLAPEIYLVEYWDEALGPPLDWWSLGVTAFEMFATGDHPFHCTQNEKKSCHFRRTAALETLRAGTLWQPSVRQLGARDDWIHMAYHLSDAPYWESLAVRLNDFPEIRTALTGLLTRRASQRWGYKELHCLSHPNTQTLGLIGIIEGHHASPIAHDTPGF